MWMLMQRELFGISAFGQDFALYLIQHSLDLKMLPKHGGWGPPAGVNFAHPCTGGNSAALFLHPPPWEREEDLGQSTEDRVTGISTY